MAEQGGGRVTTALIGCGQRGVNAHGVTAQQSGKLDLIAVCDLDEQRLQAAASALHVLAERDYHRLLARDDLQTVIIALASPSTAARRGADPSGQGSGLVGAPGVPQARPGGE